VTLLGHHHYSTGVLWEGAGAGALTATLGGIVVAGVTLKGRERKEDADTARALTDQGREGNLRELTTNGVHRFSAGQIRANVVARFDNGVTVSVPSLSGMRLARMRSVDATIYTSLGAAQQALADHANGADYSGAVAQVHDMYFPLLLSEPVPLDAKLHATDEGLVWAGSRIGGITRELALSADRGTAARQAQQAADSVRFFATPLQKHLFWGGAAAVAIGLIATDQFISKASDQYNAANPGPTNG
jgi:hypothetical protein